jgi:hypothetical protein
MSTWAVLAAKQAVIATGFGAGLVPAIGTGSLDGFVIGAAMTGACFTALTAPGRARRRAAAMAIAETAGTGLAAAASATAVAGAGVIGLAGLASPADTIDPVAYVGLDSPVRLARPGDVASPASVDGADAAETARSALLRRYFLAAEQFEPNWSRPVQADEDTPAQDQGESRQDGHAGDWAAGDWAEDGQGVSGYRSRHRLGEGSPIRRPRQETRRSAPKHAAPPSSFASRMSSIFASRAILSVVRD